MAIAARPFGITLLAVLHVLQAILFFVGGIALITLGAFVGRGFFGAHRLLGGAASLIGVVLVFVALLYLVLGWGLWSGKGWAWTVSMILAGVGIIISLISLLRGGLGSLIVLILDAIIIYYLLTPHVRTFFGEYKQTIQTGPPTQTIQSAPQSTFKDRVCPNCGAPVQVSDKFCSHCGKAFP